MLSQFSSFILRKNSASCLSACLHTTEGQGDKPVLSIIKIKDVNTTRDTVGKPFRLIPPLAKLLGNRNLNFRKTGNNEYVILWYM
jgi:hypothetical protein